MRNLSGISVLQGGEDVNFTQFGIDMEMAPALAAGRRKLNGSIWNFMAPKQH